MPSRRALRTLAVLFGLALMVVLLAGTGLVLGVRRGMVPQFTSELPVWPGVELTVRNGPQSVCHPYQFCPRQIGLYAGMSVWVTWRRKSGRELGPRLLFLPTISQRTGAQRWIK